MEAEAIHAELEAAQVVDHAIFDGVRAIPGLMDTVVEQVDANLTQMNVTIECPAPSSNQLVPLRCLTPSSIAVSTLPPRC